MWGVSSIAMPELNQDGCRRRGVVVIRGVVIVGSVAWCVCRMPSRDARQRVLQLLVLVGLEANGSFQAQLRACFCMSSTHDGSWMFVEEAA